MGNIAAMKKLRAYLKSLTPEQKTKFAKRCKTTLAYLRKRVCVSGKIGETLAIALEYESGGEVPLMDTRPDLLRTLKNAGYQKMSPRDRRQKSHKVAV